MNIKNILNRSEIIGNINGDIAEKILNLNDTELVQLQKLAKSLKEKYYNKNISFFYPGQYFPSISITGSYCEQNCKHCNKHYLVSMVQAPTPDILLKKCQELDKNGAVGCLVSGGFDKEAKLPFENFITTLKKIKSTTNLILNLHTGLINKELALQLGEIGIDVVSFDVTADDYTIKEIYGLNKTKNDYIKSLNWLLASKIKFIAPHICIGLNPNNILSEFQALSLIKDMNPKLIVLIALIPTRGTPLENQTPPSPEFISKIICLTRLMYPKSQISLGCMRPKKRNIKVETELIALNSGIDRLVLPSRKTIDYASSNSFIISHFNSCCAIPTHLIKPFNLNI
ncbi:MAG: radical SAM protein [Candidatus Helarchaeota archaeon]